MLKYLLLMALLASPALADEVEYECEGDYNKGATYDEYDNSSVAIHAKFTATILGDLGGDDGDEFSVSKANLVMKATNNKNKDAGSFRVRNTSAKVYKGKIDRYKNHARIFMGKGEPEAYNNLETDPSFYVFIPASDDGFDGVAWVQRSNTGQEALPAFKLKCK